ncbi:hypothetical protein DICSQDRAFT_83538 [Dichomitus squalens LYAD-421 SS1]|uniref:uncharacterized protein n=1 Tax=Dichomitus squalens (strain LYAD-421) TaxID=732165 RepID=UPI0004414C8E|nr:uncharacterized protein DICSQDRAFT_83538 [Dichomitus squalens LYAD-421 SS1]EJF62859.1 hypothetical protein DICSQDRAFT_83538 [Dichomitus squalens LYAD-421 SS1]
MATPVQVALRKLLPLPSQLPPSLSPRPGNLYEVLARFPKDGVGQKVHQTRWSAKGIAGSYWEITRTSLKCEGKHGKAWGHLVWKGKRINARDTEIRGGLKYKWMVGKSDPGPSFQPLPRTSPSPRKS